MEETSNLHQSLDSSLRDFATAFDACQSPKEALRVVQDAGLTPDSAGRLLYAAGQSISVQLLGECLGNHGDFWKQVAVSYPQNFKCFAGMDIVAAIRAYLYRFRLPGESAQIERIVDGFARSYFHHNSAESKEVVQVVEYDSDDEGLEVISHRSCWDEGVSGWYVHQPLSGPKLLPCCAHCGALDGERGDLVVCQGCNLLHFCRKCRRTASRYGHAVCGMIGYGRACVAARSAAGSLGYNQQITSQRSLSGCGLIEISCISERSLNWAPVSPFRNEDSVMVLAYAIIMLTTNLHSAHVKEKMKKHEFIKQNNEVNGGGNFPGDFLSQVYEDIKREELKVMRKAD